MQTVSINNTKQCNFIMEIAKLTQYGLSDKQIGTHLLKHYKTIAYHRKQHGINSGRSHKAELSQKNRGMTMNRRPYVGMQVNQSRRRLRHGLNALIPLICKDSNCPFKDTCDIPADLRTTGEPCTIESKVSSSLKTQYWAAFQVNRDDIETLSHIDHLVNVEIKLLRCNRLFTVHPALVLTTWEENEYPRKILNPIAQYELLFLKEWGRVLNKLRTEHYINAHT
jgi:hypothetical protein